MKRSVERSGNKIPYLTEKGIFDDWSDKISWWTNGFYAGQLYHAYGDEKFRQAAEQMEEKLEGSLMDYRGMDHDSGFKWLLTAVANYKMTGNKESKNRGLLAAANLAGRFNLAGSFIRAWNDEGDGATAGWAIYGFALSYRHSNEEKYLETAKKVARYFVSCIPESGMIPVDFCQDAELDWEDSTAAAIAACGMLEIEQHISEKEKGLYHEAASCLISRLPEIPKNPAFSRTC